MTREAEFRKKHLPEISTLNPGKQEEFESDLDSLLKERAEKAFTKGYKVSRNLKLNPFDKIAICYCNKKFNEWYDTFINK